MRPTIAQVQVAMPAGGEEPARRFCGAPLGLAGVAKPETLRGRGGGWFATGNIALHPGVDPAFRPAGKAHVAFQVAGLAARRERLVAAGCAMTDDEPLPGVARFFAADLFGNRGELLEPD